MKKDSKAPQHSESDGDLVSIEEDEIDGSSTMPIDTDLPDPGELDESLPNSARETKKADLLKAWRGRYSDDGGI